MNKRQVDNLMARGKKKSLPIKEVVTSLLVIGFIFTIWAADLGSPEYEVTSTEVVTVRSGDTLWNIAFTVKANVDIRRIVDDIRAINDIDPGDLRPGMKIEVPEYFDYSGYHNRKEVDVNDNW